MPAFGVSRSSRCFTYRRGRNGARRLGINVVIAVVALIWISGGCSSEPAPSAPESKTASDEAISKSPSASTETAAQYGPKPQVVRIETNLGAISIKLDVMKSPGTVHNFLNYVSEGFYDNTLFHYVAPGNMVLAGGYTADYEPKPATSAPIWSEAHNGRKNLRGTVAMTRDAAVIDSATSQFFINLADAPQRDHISDSPDEYGYCVFGDVIEGMDVADRIGASTTQDRGGELAQSPQTPVVISSIRIL